jgi:hypothetical protein
MTRVRSLQTAFTSGVLDDRLEPREDLKFYFSGLRQGLNIEFVPQGGFVRRAGTSFCGLTRNVLTPVNITGVVISRPLGVVPGLPPPPPPPPPPEPEPELPPDFDRDFR